MIARRSAVLALGITTDGSKVPLGVDVGSTENAALCTSLLQSLIDRGLRIDHRILVVIDGAFFLAALDPASGRLDFVNAGHNPPLLVRKDGSVQQLATGGLVLGLFENVVYEEGSVGIERGDMLVAYSDGVTETRSPEDEDFGEEKLTALVVASRTLGPRALQDAGPASGQPRHGHGQQPTGECRASAGHIERSPSSRRRRRSRSPAARRRAPSLAGQGHR